MVARADRSQVRLRELRELSLRSEVGVANPVEHVVVGSLGRRHAHAERDSARDLGHVMPGAQYCTGIGNRKVHHSRGR